MSGDSDILVGDSSSPTINISPLSASGTLAISHLGSEITQCLAPAVAAIREGRAPRSIALAALEATNRLFASLAKEPALGAEVSNMLSMASHPLAEVHTELAGLERYEPPGPITSAAARRRSSKDQTLERHAKAVVAVRWLQRLRSNPMSRGRALKVVALAECGSESQIDNWLAYFDRPNTPRRHEAVHNLWREVEQFYEEKGGAFEDASPTDVLKWLSQKNSED